MTNQLAIVIPYYKRKYFKETLESLKNQTNKNFTVYIGNDGSPKKITRLIDEYNNYFKIKYQEFNHLGPHNLSKHWERCITMTASEPWIQILGDDDTLSNNFVDEFYKIIQNPEINKSLNLIYFYRQEIDENSQPINNTIIYANSAFVGSLDFYVKKIMGITSLSMSEQVFSRTAYNKHGFVEFYGAFGTDDILFLEYTKLDVFYYCNTAHSNVRISKEHLSSNQDKAVKNNRIKAFKQSRKYIINKYGKQFSKYQQLQLFLKFCILEKRPTQIPAHLLFNVPITFGKLIINNFNPTNK